MTDPDSLPESFYLSDKLLWAEIDDFTHPNSLVQFIRLNPELFKLAQELATDAFFDDLKSKHKAMRFLAEILFAIGYLNFEGGDDESGPLASEQPDDR